MRQIICVLGLILALSGCATLERHPRLTAVGTALLVGSVAASIEMRSGGRQVAPVQMRCLCETK